MTIKKGYRVPNTDLEPVSDQRSCYLQLKKYEILKAIIVKPAQTTTTIRWPLV